MKVKIKEDDEFLKIKAGDIFQAESYDDCKVSLIKRESDEFDPECNQYIHDVLFFVKGKWVERDCGCCTDYGDDE